MITEDPGDLLTTHTAPPGLLDEAIRRRTRSPANRRWIPMAAAAAAIFACGVGVGSVMSDGGTVAPTVAVAPDSDDDKPIPVRLLVVAPGAAHVNVAGSFNDWAPEAAPMTPVGDGLFRAVLELPPGHHEYMFVVDGTDWITDETASLFRDDGFGNRNAVLEI